MVRVDMQSSMRDLKAWVAERLTGDDFDQTLPEWKSVPARRVVNFLFAALCSPDEVVKTRAVTAMGVVVAHLAERDLEAARVIMRRFMWNLNDESGGIGWGSPEAMGEIMARSERLAAEYTHVLVSYLREDGNFLEHPILQRGVLRGLARLSEVRPRLLQDSAEYVSPFLYSEDPVLRELSMKVLKLIAAH